MQVIPNKYLQTNLNRLESGPGSLLKAENIRLDGGRIRRRNGQKLMVPEDPFGIANVSGYESMRCKKLFFYNNRVWGYFANGIDGDCIAYFDTTAGNGQWRVSQFATDAFNYGSGEIAPILQESNKRLLFSSVNGIMSSPKMTGDDLLDNTASTIQTQMRQAGCPPAVPFTSNCQMVDTGATYNANWLPDDCNVSYRHVWKYINANGAVIYGAVSDIKRMTNSSGSLRAVQLDLTIPFEIVQAIDVARYSVQIYRTLTTTPAINGVAPDPGDEMYLVLQVRPTATDIGNGYITVQDIISPAALQGPLYTNETEQGASASRTRPPRSKAMADYAGCAWYGNVLNRWLLDFQLVSVRDPSSTTQTGLNDGDIIVLGERCYEAKDTITIADNQFQIDATSGYANMFTRIQNTLSNLHTKYNRNALRGYFNLMTQSGPDNITGRAYLEQISDNYVQGSFIPYIGLYRQSGWPAVAGDEPACIVPTPLVTEAKGKGHRITGMVGVGGLITFSLASTADFDVGDTVNLAQLNTYQDLSLPPGSQGDGVVGFTPGQYVVASVFANTFTLTGVTGTINRTIGAGSFSTLWTSFGVVHCVFDAQTGLKSPAVGQQQEQTNRMMYSALYEPQNAPALNYFDVGASDKDIIAIKRLNRSLFVFKEDGLFRVSGFYPTFTVQQFDPDVILLGPDLVDSMGGSLYCMTSRGIYRISENESQRISYQIENIIQRIALRYRSAIKQRGFAVGNHDDHSVTFWLPSQGASPDIGFVFDGQGWTTRTDQANWACCGIDPDDPDDRYSLYTIKQAGSGWLTKQRKDNNGYDMADEQLTGQLNAWTGGDPASIDITFDANDAGAIDTSMLIDGLCVVPSNPALRMICKNAIQTGAFDWTFEMEFVDPQYTVADLSVGPVRVFLPIHSEWQHNIHGSDDIDMVKHYTEFSIVFQQPYFSKSDVGFASDISPSTEWLQNNMRGFVLLRNDPGDWPICADDDVLADKNIKCLVARSKARCSQLRVSFRNTRALQYISSYGHTIREDLGGTNIERNNG